MSLNGKIINQLQLLKHNVQNVVAQDIISLGLKEGLKYKTCSLILLKKERNNAAKEKIITTVPFSFFSSKSPALCRVHSVSGSETPHEREMYEEMAAIEEEAIEDVKDIKNQG